MYLADGRQTNETTNVDVEQVEEGAQSSEPNALKKEDTGESKGQADDVDEWETIDVEDATDQGAPQEGIADDWHIINKGDVAANEDYVFRQVQAAQVKGKCVVQ